MSGRRWIYWGVTGITAAFMLSSSVPDLLQIPQAIAVLQHLGYPPYLLVFLGTAKTLGVAALLAPWDSRVKEWAFAGLTIDVTGALYSHLSVGDPLNVWLPAAIGLILLSSSYLAYRVRE
jgi:DoxX-like protein